MTERKTSVRVSILGEEYTLRSTTTPEATAAVASMVDRQIREIMQSGSVVESHKAAILACQRMAGELSVARAEADRLTEQMAALSQEIRPWLPPAKRYD
jgi:cell division protein ZapA